MKMTRPTIEGAIARVRNDRDARFAALLAAVFAFSLGFMLGFLISGSSSEPAPGDSDERAI